MGAGAHVPYLTERMLHQSTALAPLGAVAVQHRERLDGSGYPRGLSGGVISHAGAAARAPLTRTSRCANHVRTAPLLTVRRPPPNSARGRAGRLDGDAVRRRSGRSGACNRPAPRRAGRADRPRSRRVEVAGRGLSSKQIATQLVIAPKTARNHIEHIYAKIGASNRASASLFAMQHGLLSSDPR